MEVVGYLVVFGGLILIVVCSWLSWQEEIQVDKPVMVIKQRFGRVVYVKVMENLKDKEWITVIPLIEKLETKDLGVTTINIPVSGVSAPDQVPLKMPVSLQVSPDPENLDPYFQNGQADGVKEKITPVLEQEVRQWAATVPNGYQPPVGASNQQPIAAPGTPTPTNPQLPEWDWKAVRAAQDALTKLLSKSLVVECGGNPDDEKTKDRLLKYGLRLHKITIGSIELEGDMAKLQEAEAKESQERRAELAHITTQLEIAKRAAEAMKTPGVTKAFQLTQEFEMIQRGHGGVFKGNVPLILGLPQFLGSKNPAKEKEKGDDNEDREETSRKESGNKDKKKKKGGK